MMKTGKNPMTVTWKNPTMVTGKNQKTKLTMLNYYVVYYEKKEEKIKVKRIKMLIKKMMMSKNSTVP